MEQEKIDKIWAWVESASSKLGDAAMKVTDFASDQIPLFIQELLTYNFYHSLLWFIVLGLLSGSMLYASYRLIKFAVNADNYDDKVGPSVFFAAMFFIFGGTIFFANLSHNTDWIKIKLAPRLYMVEYCQKQYQAIKK